jgi:dextranase
MFLPRLLCAGVLLASLTACAFTAADEMPINNLPMVFSGDFMPVQITHIQPDKAFYRPGETVQLTVTLSFDEALVPAPTLFAVITHLAEQIRVEQAPLASSPGEQTLVLEFPAGERAPIGYGVNLLVRLADGKILGAATTGYDVLERWTQSPRYGFLSDFQPGRSDAVETMAILARYHLNGLQFYDWMYRHEQLLTDHDPYVDLLGRELSYTTVEALIESAHQRNIAAMPYTAVYGASLQFFHQHPEWGLYQRDGKPVLFGDNFMALMDPRPDSPWGRHLLGEFEKVLGQTPFDGIHLDQYGDPKEGYDAEGQHFALDQALADFINQTSALVKEHRPDGAVVFNAVTNWPVEVVAPANQDLVYIEVWSPYNWFTDLHQLIVDAQAWGGGKPVVLAAYIDPAAETNARLMNAVIFASGGSHIELGEQCGGAPGMLADPYFPKYGEMSSLLAEQMLRLYDFAVRYQDVIGPRTRDATPAYRERISLQAEGTLVNTDPAALKNKVWPIVRDSQIDDSDYTAVSLINLMGIQHPDWNRLLPDSPQPQHQLELTISEVSRPVEKVFLASPDGENLALQEMQFTLQSRELRVVIPALEIWDLILIAWGGAE